MNSANSHSPLPVTGRERKRTPMACMNCRERKLKCRPVGSIDSAPCERCVKEGTACEYRPVDSGSAPNNPSSNYFIQDNNDIKLHYPTHSAPPLNEDYAPPVGYPYVPTQGGYDLNQTYPSAPFQTNPPYPTPPYQQQPPSPYPVTPYYPTFPPGYPGDRVNYQPTPPNQYGGSSQYMSYPPAQGQESGPYYHRDPFNGYVNMDGSNSRE